MLKQLQKRKSDNASIISGSRQQGFTIIEVLVVLAIAGLIMVVVFLAVPALNRSGRNNGLSTSANNLLAGVGNYVSNNGGSLPATQASAAPSASNTVTIGSSGNTETVKVDGGVVAFSINGTTLTSGDSIGKMQVITGTTAVCNSGGTGLSGGAASARSYVILYVAEGSGSSNLLKCVGN